MSISKKKVFHAAVGLLTVVSVSILGYAAASNTETGTIIFSPKTMLSNSWERYKEHYMDTDTGRVFDRQRNDITTSEGQSYAMLRSVWVNDKDVFDATWNWTKDNLQRDGDHLFAWLYGQREDGTSGILEREGGLNTASDADTDIALALLLAYARWGENDYLEEAHLIIRDIWEYEVIIIAGRPYLAATDVDKRSGTEYVVINPSYLAPYAYRIFQEIDPDNNWLELADSSYELMQKILESDEWHVPPDWIAVRRADGAIFPAEGHSADFGFDAMRIPWRLALDHIWFGTPKAMRAMETMSFFAEEWERDETILAKYDGGGKRAADYEAPATYGGAIGYFIVTNPDLAEEVHESKLKPLYNPDTNDWAKRLHYYDDNWAWFGIAMYHGLLPNIWAEI